MFKQAEPVDAMVVSLKALREHGAPIVAAFDGASSVTINGCTFRREHALDTKSSFTLRWSHGKSYVNCTYSDDNSDPSGDRKFIAYQEFKSVSNEVLTLTGMIIGAAIGAIAVRKLNVRTKERIYVVLRFLDKRQYLFLLGIAAAVQAAAFFAFRYYTLGVLLSIAAATNCAFAILKKRR